MRLGIAASNRSLLLKWNATVPWINTESVIYRKNALQVFEAIGVSTTSQFWDTGLYNGVSYCYYVETKGHYDQNFYPPVLLNKSQQLCGTPVDTMRPCPPVLYVETPCNQISETDVKLNWGYPDSCTHDVIYYKILWRKNSKDNWTTIDSVKAGLGSYKDKRIQLKNSIIGCYAVVAVDSFFNESYAVNMICIDNCPSYTIPNIFTPNNDGKNDLLIPFPYRFIDRIDLTIYNRWGMPVFHTIDPDINWNGNDNGKGEECAEGVYFYICDVFENYLDSIKKRTIRGTITVVR